MTDSLAATDHVLLEEAAQQAREQQHRDAAQRHAERLAEYREAAPKIAKAAAADVLGPYADRGIWTATGGPSDSYSSSYSATAEIDGLRFLATRRPVDYGHDETLYLLVPCPNPDHEPQDRRIEIPYLAYLAEVLDDLEQQTLRAHPSCYGCYLQREEQGIEPPAAKPAPTAPERMLLALETLIEERINDRLDGFLSTYLPDRI